MQTLTVISAKIPSEPCWLHSTLSSSPVSSSSSSLLWSSPLSALFFLCSTLATPLLCSPLLPLLTCLLPSPLKKNPLCPRHVVRRAHIYMFSSPLLFTFFFLIRCKINPVIPPFSHSSFFLFGSSGVTVAPTASYCILLLPDVMFIFHVIFKTERQVGSSGADVWHKSSRQVGETPLSSPLQIVSITLSASLLPLSVCFSVIPSKWRPHGRLCPLVSLSCLPAGIMWGDYSDRRANTNGGAMGQSSHLKKNCTCLCQVSSSTCVHMEWLQW